MITLVDLQEFWRKLRDKKMNKICKEDPWIHNSLCAENLRLSSKMTDWDLKNFQDHKDKK